MGTFVLSFLTWAATWPWLCGSRSKKRPSTCQAHDHNCLFIIVCFLQVTKLSGDKTAICRIAHMEKFSWCSIRRYMDMNKDRYNWHISKSVISHTATLFLGPNGDTINARSVWKYHFDHCLHLIEYRHLWLTILILLP